MPQGCIGLYLGPDRLDRVQVGGVGRRVATTKIAFWWFGTVSRWFRSPFASIGHDLSLRNPFRGAILGL
jgi:hypothetical protein